MSRPGGIGSRGKERGAPQRGPAEEQEDEEEERLEKPKGDSEVHAAEDPIPSPNWNAFWQYGGIRQPKPREPQPLRQLSPTRTVA